MTRRLICAIAALLTFSAHARADSKIGLPADLGTAATSGSAAHDGIPERAHRIHVAMACGNEYSFSRSFGLASRHGKGNWNPSDDASWPVTLMLGKAELLLSTVPREQCTAFLTGDVANDWAPLTVDGKVDGESAAGVVNRVYRELYDSLPDGSAPACQNVAIDQESPIGGGKFVFLRIPKPCLARQIRAVMTDPKHGPWNQKNNVVTPELPGTSANKLPCLSELKTKVTGVDGDWDQAVIEYTRLASLLYRISFDRSIFNDIQASIDVLNSRFLTIRSSPGDATARETFNLVTTCGNTGNKFGSALDTANGNSSDPGSDQYSKDGQDAVGHDSFWDSLLKFLAAVLTVAAIALAAAAVAVAVGIAAAAAGAGALAVALAIGVGVFIFVTFIFGGIQETENHLLMENTSRYLKNKLMMSELSSKGYKDAFDTIADLNEDVRSWLLDDLKRIARDDFREYNAKPYNRLSHASILNLLDYACDVSWDYNFANLIDNSDRSCDDKDRAIVTAAAAVLDLSAAKDAVGSLEGRRLVPYRRLAEQNYQFYENNRPLLELGAGADNQLAGLQVWTGQMKHAPDHVAKPASFGDLEWYSTSRYRPDPLILDIAVNKTIAREQQYRHSTRERYVSGNGWLITAGGTDEGPAQGFSGLFGWYTLFPEINADVTNDKGVGVPTTLMTGAVSGDTAPDGTPQGRELVKQFLRFDGNKKDWGKNDDKPMWSFSDNNCVAGSFACGTNLMMPSDFDQASCHNADVAQNFFVVDSTKCKSFNDNDGNNANDIFIAIFQGTKNWGFFEVAQQSAYSFSAASFAAVIKTNNSGRFDKMNSADSGDRVEYYAVTQNRLLKFTPKDEAFGADRRACGVVNHESDARFTISNVPAAQQGACLSVGPRIFIDLSDPKNPIRRGEGGLVLDPLYY